MANIWIENHGVFSVSDEKVQDLMQWLQSNGGVSAEGASPPNFDGKTLLNEEVPPPQGGANVGNPKPNIKPDGSGSYDFGGTWM